MVVGAVGVGAAQPLGQDMEKHLGSATTLPQMAEKTAKDRLLLIAI